MCVTIRFLLSSMMETHRTQQYELTVRACVRVAEPPAVVEPEKWEEQQLSSLELLIQTHNKNPVERVSKSSDTHCSRVTTCSSVTPKLDFCVYLDLQRVNDSLTIRAEPDNFTVGEFIAVGSVVYFLKTLNISVRRYDVKKYMFFTAEIKKRRTRLRSLKTLQNWRPVFASCGCQRSDVLLGDST